MLRAADHNDIDIVKPFSGDSVDSLCGQTATAPITTLFRPFFAPNDCIRKHFKTRHGLKKSYVPVTSR